MNYNFLFRIIMDNDSIEEKLWNDTSIPVDDPLEGTIIVISNDLLYPINNNTFYTFI